MPKKFPAIHVTSTETERLQHLQNLKAADINPYPARIERTHTLAQLTQDGKEVKEATIVGRVQRVSSSSSHEATILLSDEHEELAIEIDVSQLDQTSTCIFQNLDMGDYLKAAVKIKRTGSIAAHQLTMLCKSPRSASRSPATNWEAMHAHTRSRELLYKRQALIQAVRQYFSTQAFLELETPLLTRSIDFGHVITPLQSTFHFPDGGQEAVYLSLAPEYYMKRVLVGGFERVFQVTKFFRDGDLSFKHNPEFLAVEWYEAYADYHRTMDRIEELCTFIVSQVFDTLRIPYQGETIDFTRPWPRMTVKEALRQYGDIDMEMVYHPEQVANYLRDLGVTDIESSLPWENMFMRLMDVVVESRLGRNPVFLYDYPIEDEVLAKTSEDGKAIERFEVYIGGMELCNGYTELNDP